MREIKFRGKRKGEPNEWLFGDLNQICGRVFIFQRGEHSSVNSYDYYEVIPETVGEFIGLKDKVEKDVYEGDIVSCNRYTCGDEFIVTIDDIRNLPRELFGSNLNFREVVGNIHDNHELLKTNNP